VDCVAFTGSTEVGKLFLQYSGQSNMKTVWLECGGKSPNLIFANCKNLDAAAEASAFAIFFNQGEVCSANSRVLVEESIKGEFLSLLKKHSEKWRPDYPLNPTSTAGALVTCEHNDY
jgi:gamma-glutamyl-gamma-aminobutyraldehyde dehydrogenase